jgi:hypothetical protein
MKLCVLDAVPLYAQAHHTRSASAHHPAPCGTQATGRSSSSLPAQVQHCVGLAYLSEPADRLVQHSALAVAADLEERAWLRPGRQQAKVVTWCPWRLTSGLWGAGRGRRGCLARLVTLGWRNEGLHD